MITCSCSVLKRGLLTEKTAPFQSKFLFLQHRRLEGHIAFGLPSVRLFVRPPVCSSRFYYEPLISDRNNFSSWCTSHPGTYYQISNQWSLLVQEQKFKIDLQDGSHFEFLIEMILTVFDWKVTPILTTKFRVMALSILEKYSRTSMARTPMARLPWMSRTRS